MGNDCLKTAENWTVYLLKTSQNLDGHYLLMIISASIKTGKEKKSLTVAEYYKKLYLDIYKNR